MMYFNFLKDYVINWQSEDETSIDWNQATSAFVRSSSPTLADICQQETRLHEVGYEFPQMLKAFWSEIGCGYLCSTDVLDNGLEEPKTILDIYFQANDWSSVKLTCDLLDKNELPFFRINSLEYLTIGLEEGVNLGKIYYLGEEIASDLIDFVTRLLHNPSYYLELELTK